MKIAYSLLAIITIGLVALTGCVSPLMSDNPEARKQAVEKLADPKDLFFVAMNVEACFSGGILEPAKFQRLRECQYPDDVRLAAVQKLTNPEYLVCCATWQDGNCYEDPGCRGKAFEYHGERYYKGSDEKWAFRVKVSPGDAVRVAALKKIAEEEMFKKVAGLLKAEKGKSYDEEQAYMRLIPLSEDDRGNNHKTYKSFEAFRAANLLDWALTDIIKTSDARMSIILVFNGFDKGPKLAPKAYDAAMMKVSGCGSKATKALFRRVFVIKRNGGEGEEKLREGIPTDWVRHLYSQIDAPEEDIVNVAIQNCCRDFIPRIGMPSPKRDSSVRCDISDIKAVFARVTTPDVFESFFKKNDLRDFNSSMCPLPFLPKDQRNGIVEPYQNGEPTLDFRIEDATALLMNLKDENVLARVAKSARLHSIRLAAIGKIADNSILADLAKCRYEKVPIDTAFGASFSTVGASFGEGLNPITWIGKALEASELSLRKAAVARMSDITSLKSVRQLSENVELKEFISSRLASLGTSDMVTVLNADKYDKDLFVMLDGLKKDDELAQVASSAKLKGIRLMAAGRLSEEKFVACAKDMAGRIGGRCPQGHLNIGGYYLGMNIEDVFARLSAEMPELKPILYLNEKATALCLKDGKGRDLAWSNNIAGHPIHWLTLPPKIVRRIAGFDQGSFTDLADALCKKLGVEFGPDEIKLGEVSQGIGNLDTVNGETLRFFCGDILKGEDIDRTIKKAINKEQGVALANVFIDAEQAQENARYASSDRFAVKGSLRLLKTANAHKGIGGSSGRIIQKN